MNLMLLCSAVLLAGCRSQNPGKGEYVVKPAGPAGQKGKDRAQAKAKGTVIKPIFPAGSATTPAPSPFIAHREPDTSSSPKATASSWIRLADWARTHHLGTLRQISWSQEPAFELSAPRGVFRVEVNSRQAQFDGTSLWLGFSPRMVNGQVCLRALDIAKNLKPLLTARPLTVPPSRILVLDPGHGGENTGARSVLDGSLEKTYTLDWALRLRKLLKGRGWKVVLTRASDVDVGLSERVAIAEAAQADLFISLHFNASGGGNHQSGLEAYCLTPQGMPSTLTREFPDNPDATFPNNAFDEANLQLAVCLQRHLLQATHGADRGIRRARFMTVLRGQHCPAVLLEGGYLSNPEEAAKIAAPDYRQTLAEAVAEGLMQITEDGGWKVEVGHSAEN